MIGRILGGLDIHRTTANLFGNSAAGGQWPSALPNLFDFLGLQLPRYILLTATWAGVTGGDGTSNGNVRVVYTPAATTPPVAANQKRLLGKALTTDPILLAATNVTMFSTGTVADGIHQSIWFLASSNAATAPHEFLPIAGPYLAVECTNPGLAYSGGQVSFNVKFIG